MDKLDFFKTGKPKVTPFKLPNGKQIMLKALTLTERQKMKVAVNKDVAKGTALMICMSCEHLDEKDVASVEDMDGSLIDLIADEVLEISGLVDKVKK